MIRPITLLLFAVFISGCATHRPSVPEITESPRSGLALPNPILVGVLDARADKSDSDAIVAAIQHGVSRVYPNAVQSIGYFDQIPQGRVGLRIRIMANSAEFGSRIVTASAVTNTLVTARTLAGSSWQPVVNTAYQQTSITTALETEGWWIGTSWLELEIVDHRDSAAETFTLPVIAEEREPNTFGYRSASRATERAWGRVSQQLFRVMDSMIMTLRDQEQR